MIVTHIEENVAELTEEELSATHVEKVVLPLEALRKRVQRVTSDHGREFGIRLSGSENLRYGDVLVRDDRGIVIVAVASSDVLMIAPSSIVEMARVAHALGNRHLPAQFLGAADVIDGLEGHDGVMVIEYDHTAEDYIQSQGVRYIRTERTMPVPFRHAEHTH